ncbi:MAG: hypothetical protein Q4D02_07650 [Clostridia bacterium]|nr:hypothetical protein [Clostridia bacterium]
MKKITINELKVARERLGFTSIQRVAIDNIIKVLETNESSIVKSVAIDRYSYLRDLANYCTWLTLKYFDKYEYLTVPDGQTPYTLLNPATGTIPKDIITEIFDVLDGKVSPQPGKGAKYTGSAGRIYGYAQGRSDNINLVLDCFGNTIFTCLQILYLISDHFESEMSKCK